MTKKKIIVIFIAAFVVIASVITTLCIILRKPHDEPSMKVTLSLDVTEKSLIEDEIFVLTVTTNSADTVKWNSSDSKVASVSSKGRVIAKTAGEATISASVEGVIADCKITVKADPNALTKINFEESVLRLSENGDGRRIKGTVTTLNGQKTLEEANATYSVDNPKVATVSADGAVTPVSTGSALVTVVAEGRKKTVSVEVYTMLVGSAEEWNRMLSLPGDPNARFYLTCDIDFTGKEYNVKNESAGYVLLKNSFCGTLDGGGHTVKNVTFNDSVSPQSLFGTIVGCTIKNIAFENVRFTSSEAAGIAIRMIQHYNEVDGEGNPLTKTDDKGKPYDVITYAPCYLNDVSGDFAFASHGACGIARTYFGGGIENVFINARMTDGSDMNEKTDFAVAKESMIWYDNNYINNVVVLSEKGGLNTEWDTKYDGIGRTISLSLLYVLDTRMEAGYLVRTLFDNNVWTVTPNNLPRLK